MSEDKFLNKYRILTTRAPWHGYDGGIYFVTICTQQKEHFFGEIRSVVCKNDGTRCDDGTRNITSLRGEPQMQLSPIGQYAHEQFTNVSTHYPYAEIPLFVIMPNHIHAIVIIDGEKTPYQRRIVSNDATTKVKCGDVADYDDHCSDAVHHVATVERETFDNNTNAGHHVATVERETFDNNTNAGHHVATKDRDMKHTANMQGWLSVVVGGLKRAITCYAHQQNIPFAWQSRFHDRIIRNQNELNRIALYIEQNVAKWNANDLMG